MSSTHEKPNLEEWHKEIIRVRYADTDRMGLVYHANYFIFFEACRSSLIRSLWKPYSLIEEDGYVLLVIEANCRYRKGAGYDDVLNVYARVADFSGSRIRFEYKIYGNNDNKLLVEGYTEHCFADKKGKPRRIPEELKKILSEQR